MSHNKDARLMYISFNSYMLTLYERQLTGYTWEVVRRLGSGLHCLSMFHKRTLGLYTLTLTAECLLCMKGNRQATHGNLCGDWFGSTLFSCAINRR